jgi:hypothetical protein
MRAIPWLIPLILVGLPCAAGAQALLTDRTLGITAANEAAMAALEQCRKEGHRVTVTVLDHAARTKVMLRDDRRQSPYRATQPEQGVHRAHLPYAFR